MGYNQEQFAGNVWVTSPNATLLEHGQICCYGAIDDAMAQSIINQVFFLDHEHPGREITLNVNSPGGCVSAGLAIIDALMMVSCDVRTIGFGTVASMASIILAKGTPGKRMATPHCEVMIHQMAGQVAGQQTDIETQARRMKSLRSTVDRILAEATGHTEKDIHEETERDRWFSASEALEFGLIDEIAGSGKAGA